MSFQEDDEHTIEEDEALITEEERREELANLKNECDVPLEELLRHYTKNKGEICFSDDNCFETRFFFLCW